MSRVVPEARGHVNPRNGEGRRVIFHGCVASAGRRIQERPAGKHTGKPVARDGQHPGKYSVLNPLHPTNPAAGFFRFPTRTIIHVAEVVPAGHGESLAMQATFRAPHAETLRASGPADEGQPQAVPRPGTAARITLRV